MSLEPPDGWSELLLGDACDVVAGPAFKSKDFLKQGEYRLCRGANVSQQTLDWTDTRYWADLDGYETYQLQVGDVILAMDRPWLEAGLKYARVREHDLPALLVQRVARLRSARQLDQRFLYYLIGSPAFTSHVRSVSTGSTVPHISGKQIKEFSAPVPPVSEQSAIAEILGSLDDRIDWAERGCSTAKATLRALSQLADTQGPTVTVADIAVLKRETLSVTALSGGTWSHHSIPAFDAGMQPTVEAGVEIKSGKYRVPDNSVLLSKLNPDINRVWMTETGLPYPSVCSTEFLPLVPKVGVPAGALLGALMTDGFVGQMAERVSGGTKSHQRVKPADVLGAKVGSPSALMEAQLQLCESLGEYIRMLLSEVRTLRHTRDVLLPQLVTGKLRIKDVDGFLKRAGLT